MVAHKRLRPSSESHFTSQHIIASVSTMFTANDKIVAPEDRKINRTTLKIVKPRHWSSFNANQNTLTYSNVLCVGKRSSRTWVHIPRAASFPSTSSCTLETLYPSKHRYLYPLSLSLFLFLSSFPFFPFPSSFSFPVEAEQPSGALFLILSRFRAFPYHETRPIRGGTPRFWQRGFHATGIDRNKNAI